MEVLDILRDIGLMVWFGDSGKFVRNKIVFNTHKLGKDSTNLIAQYFKEAQIGECKVFFERGHSRLKLLPETTERFMLIIANKAPEFMQNQFLGKQYAK